ESLEQPAIVASRTELDRELIQRRGAIERQRLASPIRRLFRVSGGLVRMARLAPVQHERLGVPALRRRQAAGEKLVTAPPLASVDAVEDRFADAIVIALDRVADARPARASEMLAPER